MFYYVEEVVEEVEQVEEGNDSRTDGQVMTSSTKPSDNYGCFDTPLMSKRCLLAG